MREPRSYIVRIYRQGYRSLSGIVEDPQTGSRRPFRNTRELSALLRGPCAPARRFAGEANISTHPLERRRQE